MSSRECTPTTALARGQAAETRAAALLGAAGLSVLARNVRCRGGEIDLVALDGSVLVFVEVRSRGGGRFGSAADSITGRKQQRIVLAARHFLAGAPQHARRACRFDCILIDGDGAPAWLRDAFRAD